MGQACGEALGGGESATPSYVDRSEKTGLEKVRHATSEEIVNEEMPASVRVEPQGADGFVEEADLSASVDQSRFPPPLLIEEETVEQMVVRDEMHANVAPLHGNDTIADHREEPQLDREEEMGHSDDERVSEASIDEDGDRAASLQNAVGQDADTARDSGEPQSVGSVFRDSEKGSTLENELAPSLLNESEQSFPNSFKDVFERDVSPQHRDFEGGEDAFEESVSNPNMIFDADSRAPRLKTRKSLAKVLKTSKSFSVKDFAGVLGGTVTKGRKVEDKLAELNMMSFENMPDDLHGLQARRGKTVDTNASTDKTSSVSQRAVSFAAEEAGQKSDSVDLAEQTVSSKGKSRSMEDTTGISKSSDRSPEEVFEESPSGRRLPIAPRLKGISDEPSERSDVLMSPVSDDRTDRLEQSKALDVIGSESRGGEKQRWSLDSDDQRTSGSRMETRLKPIRSIENIEVQSMVENIDPIHVEVVYRSTAADPFRKKHRKLALTAPKDRAGLESDVSVPSSVIDSESSNRSSHSTMTNRRSSLSMESTSPRSQGTQDSRGEGGKLGWKFLRSNQSTAAIPSATSPRSAYVTTIVPPPRMTKIPQNFATQRYRRVGERDHGNRLLIVSCACITFSCSAEGERWARSWKILNSTHMSKY